jgi:hypothetical protein
MTMRLSDEDIDEHVAKIAIGAAAPGNSKSAEVALGSALKLTADAVKSLSSIARSLETLAKRNII